MSPALGNMFPSELSWICICLKCISIQFGSDAHSVGSYPISCKNDKFVLAGEVVMSDLRSGDNPVIFQLKVSKGTSHCESWGVMIG